MIVIVCVDDDMGVMFNERRQSQDRILREHIMTKTAGKKLWMNHYSKKQFEQDYLTRIHATDQFLDIAADGDYCFVENNNILPYEKRIEKIIMFKWNRKYPSDFKFSIALVENAWRLNETADLVGSSHEKITKEVYVR